MVKNTVGDKITRLQTVIKAVKRNLDGVKTNADIAMRLRYSRAGTISDYLNPDKYDADKFEDFCKKLEWEFAVNSDFIINGNEPIFLNEDGSLIDDIKISSKKEIIPLGKHVPLRLRPEEYGQAFGDWAGLPMYNVPITASFVATYRDESVYHPQYYLHDPRFRDCDFGAIITGDSMHSEIRHGDFVACKEVTDTSFLVFGDIYYIVAKNGLETCKYLQAGKDEDHILLVPRNEKISPSPIKKEMIKSLFKVRGIIRSY